MDPSLNLPDPSDERRQRYIDERKRPQIVWMLNLIRRLLADKEDGRKLRLADVGGGRGDLANAVAAFFAHQQIRAHVTVLDVNRSSLEAGQERAKAAKLDDYMSFVLCDLSNKEQVEDLLCRETFDLVFGLHCCGGVAEAAVELALACRACFCICTCCFRSNAQLSSLSRLADTIVDVNSEEALEQHRQDRKQVARLAVVVGGRGQHRAIRAMNAMRLVAAEKRFADMLLYEISQEKSKLRTWQESFPIEYSIQNRVMVGVLE